jgi:hypothetical protein
MPAITRYVCDICNKNEVNPDIFQPMQQAGTDLRLGLFFYTGSRPVMYCRDCLKEQIRIAYDLITKES